MTLSTGDFASSCARPSWWLWKFGDVWGQIEKPEKKKNTPKIVPSPLCIFQDHGSLRDGDASHDPSGTKYEAPDDVVGTAREVLWCILIAESHHLNSTC